MENVRSNKEERYLLLAAVGLRGFPHVIGGIESYCEQLYPRLLSDHDIDTVVMARDAYVQSEVYRHDGIRVVPIWAPRSPALEALVHTPLALFVALLRWKPDIVHIHGVGPAFFAPLAKLFRVKVVVTHHAADFDRPKWNNLARTFLILGEAMAARFADRVICVSETLGREFTRRHPAAAVRTCVIRHALNSRPYKVVPDFLDSLRLKPNGYMLAVGRIDSTKRLEDLVRAHACAGSGVLPLVIAGSAPDTSSLEAELRAMATSDVRFVGYREGDELISLYAGAARMFHPSEMEGFGLVVLEALSAGVPTYVSDISVHREFALPERHYFPVGDVDEIAKLMTEAVDRADFRALASQIVDHHSFDAMTSAHALVFLSQTV